LGFLGAVGAGGLIPIFTKLDGKNPYSSGLPTGCPNHQPFSKVYLTKILSPSLKKVYLMLV
jgi:hypothetical protein